MDISGNNALVGAPNADGSAAGDAGAAYMFRYDGSQWPEQGWLTASDGLEGDEFGSAVATDGRLALVGAPFADVPGGFNPGAAYVYRWDGSQWVEQAKLTASDSASLDNWGRSVALHGLTALVGGPQATVDGKFDAGAVYVWQWDGTEWVEQAKLIASDGEQGDQFGWSVALSGNTALVGARSDEVGGNLFAGSAYIFRRSGGVWSEQANLTASDAVSFDWFGESVAISGNTALVGAWMDDFDGKIDAGSAYAYGWDGSQWVEQAKLTASDGETDDWFGRSVSVSGNTALVGASVGGSIDEGSAYVFRWDGSVWTEQAIIITVEGGQGQTFDLFGRSVAIDGRLALVGASGVSNGDGLAYAYRWEP